MSVDTAVTAVKTRGRKPTVLADGKTLAQAKQEAAAAVKLAKTAYKDTRADYAAGVKAGETLQAVSVALAAESNLYSQLASLAPKDAYLKQKLKDLKQQVKEHNDSVKVHERRVKALDADNNAAAKALQKAEEALASLTTKRSTGGAEQP